MVKLTRLLAPFIPFATEVMYQNLVRGVFEGAHESVHHTDWPEVDEAVIDEKLIEQMELARRTASLGLSARSNAGIKVRQPLSKVMVYVKEGWAELADELVDIVSEELNVKGFEFIEDAENLVSYRVLPNNKLLGPKFGADFPKVRAALSALDPADVAAKVVAEETVVIEVNGERVELQAEEVLVNTEGAEGLATAEDKLLTVAIDTSLTPELKAEGLAREIVRRVQSQRKNADFNIEDRITTWYVAKDELAEVFQTWGDYIQAETLTTELITGEPPDEAFAETHKVEGQEFTIGVKQN